MNARTAGRFRRYRLLAGFAIAAFGQTLAYYAYVLNDPGNYNGAGAFGDQVAYIGLGQQILGGAWEGAMHYMPGLPALLALTQVVFGDPRLGIALVQGALFALLVVGAWHLGARVGGEGAAPWSAGLVALNPSLGYYASQALTEFMTAVLLFAVALLLVRWSRAGRWTDLLWVGLAAAALVYLRSEYLGLAIVLGLVVFVLARRRGAGQALVQAVLVVGVVVVAVVPWVARYAVATGRPTLYNESPISNLVLMGTWFRVFDEQTFGELQGLLSMSVPYDQAVQRAGAVGPRPELSARYVSQARGPYERPIGETLSLATENVRLTPRQFLVNHFVLAPVLIWAGHTPLRQADVATLPGSLRWTLWGTQLFLVLLALWQAWRLLRVREAAALGLTFFALFAFLTGTHVLFAVDDRFTVPALPLVQVLAGLGIAALVARRDVSRVPLRA